jgi:hypothetical protein
MPDNAMPPTQTQTVRPERRGREAEENEQILHILDGTRVKDKKQAAVRIQDVTGLLQMPPRLQSVPIPGTTPAAPTGPQYNALQKDVRTLHAQLTAVAIALQKRLTV